MNFSIDTDKFPISETTCMQSLKLKGELFIYLSHN